MALFSVLLALVGIADAASVTIPADFANVSSAVEFLATQAPAPHFITFEADGEYVEPVTVNIAAMDITVDGNSNDVVIRTNTLGLNMFSVVGGRLKLIGVTLTGDTGPTGIGMGIDDAICSFPVDLSGISASALPGPPTSPAIIEVEDSEFRCFFSAGAGAAIDSSNSHVEVTSSSFSQNVAFGQGGHISASGSSSSPPTVSIVNNEFEYGVTLSAGGAVSLGSVVARVEDNDFRYNDSITRGGALYVNSGLSGTVEVWNNLFLENVSLAIVGYSLFDFPGMDDTGNQLDGSAGFRYITGEGGGAYIDSESVDIWSNMFCGNVADDGGGVNIENPVTSSTIENNVFNDNWSLHYGGGAYLRAEGVIETPAVWNNTFYSNSAGQTPPGIEYEIFVFGAGGAMMADNIVLDFHNNVVAQQTFGGGVTGVHGDDYIIGDPLIFEYNLWYGNCEVGGCDPADETTQLHLAGDYAQHSFNATNVLQNDPFPTYAGVGDFDCYPDAFYAEWGTATIDAGDDTNVDWRDVDDTTNDIGFTGGMRADVVDRDMDGFKNTLDCNDLDPTVNPGQPEICDDNDNNCNGEVNEGFTDTWYWDSDGDLYGSDAPNFNGVPSVIIDCSQPAGYVAQDGDCDNEDATVNPGVAEICDDIDNDCNFIVDDEDLLSFIQYFEDIDGDNFGNSNVEITDCQQPDGYVEFGGDCDDSDDTVNPNGNEVCNGKDDDCNGFPDDEAANAPEWFVDSDSDGYGFGEAVISCYPPGAGAFVNNGSDCDDTDIEINPEALEKCDELDNDCDGGVDIDPVDGAYSTYYVDADGDGYVDENSAVNSCEDVLPDGLVERGDLAFDCNDADELELACPVECGCSVSASPGSSGWLLVLAGLLVVRRRKD